MTQAKYKRTEGSTGFWIVDGKSFVEGVIYNPKDADEYLAYCNAKAENNEQPLPYKDYLKIKQ